MHYKELNQVYAALTAPGQPFEIEEVPVRGQRLKSFKNAPPNIRAFWLATAAFGANEYLVYENDRLTYAQAHAQVATFAAWLIAQGVKSGDRVAIAMRNYPEWLLAYWACCCIGVAAVGFNAWWVGDELAYAIEDSAPKVIVCDQERFDRLMAQPEMVRGAKIVLARAQTDKPGVTRWNDIVAKPAPLPDADIDPDADACIFYTSGTTGRPKGAQLTHRGCLNNLMSMLFSGLSQATALQIATKADPVTPPIPVAIATTPLFHVTANNCLAYPVTAQGGKIVLMYKWDAGEALRLVEAEKALTLTGVPTMSREVLAHPDFAKRDTSSLLQMGGGGAPLQPDLVSKIETQSRGVRPGTGYGLTETCGIITSVTGDFFVGKPESCGMVMPNYEAKCVDDAGNTVPPGQTGELWVRGAQVIKGYLNRADATAEAITDGWFHTGDIARIDEDRFVYIVDRKKDMVLRGGENVYCAEVEAALYRHPAVAEAVAFGVPDERLGEEVGAAIVVREGASISADDLRAQAGQFISKHKIPRYVWILRDALPRNANGKFLKRELRQTLPLSEAQ
ncbi:MAG TPA: class I adenylate-forming enzyme family protein [Vitreimonas sp.]|nr:class I adenylate-forming enzyme family protein [Vitreimonas sp.]